VVKNSFIAVACFTATLALTAAEPAPTVLAPLVITATRAPQAPATLPIAIDVFTADSLKASPSFALDDTLRRSAAFSLFRRTGSLTANPTAQGVSLRGLGPSGASRSLVLLDGVPLNDPFGGWVSWTKIPVSALDRVELVRGGGSSTWGNASLGGTLQFLSRPLLSPEQREVPLPREPPTVTTAATVGDFQTRALSVSATAASRSGRDALALDAAAFATDGPGLLQTPGPIDRAADSSHQRAQLAWEHRIGAHTTLTTTARAWSEERGNGTPYQRNTSREAFLSSTLTVTPPSGPAFSATVYAQDQTFTSTFSSVNPARTAETPANDQYDVPATALGASAQATWGDPADATSAVTTLGTDFRFIEGESREHFFYSVPLAAYTRERRAGGRQTFAGLFASHARPLAERLTLTAAARLDSSADTDGFRRESTLAPGPLLRDDHYAARRDLTFSPTLGLVHQTTPLLRTRAAVYQAFRTPTLNESYRPFRIGAITTEANPALRPEKLLGGEIGFDLSPASTRAGLRATAFANELTDAVANVSLSPTLRERRNLDTVRVRGLELGGFWQVSSAPSLRLEADYLFSDATVLSGGPIAPALDGRRLAQVPRHTLTAGATWQATRALDFDLRARWTSAQYEDDLNTLVLAPSTRLDAALHYTFAERWRLTVAVENLLDANTETARTSAGLVSLAPPRWSRAELTYMW
jgi:outer membrane receptor protein involved in Fe transport